jgi:surface antigen
MQSLMAQRLLWGACLAVGVMAPANPSVAANCALYARAETGVALFGAAGGWWDAAAGRYERGHVPAVGSILVFRRTQRIPSGHVAVVAKVVSASEILVNHANWYRGTVSRGMSVVDTSAGHDWTSVAVLDLRSGKLGSDYPAYGFVYPGSGPQEIVEARAGRGFEAYADDSGTWLDLKARPALFHPAVASGDGQRGLRQATATRGNHHRKEMAARPVRKQSAAPHPPTHRLTATEARHQRA